MSEKSIADESDNKMYTRTDWLSKEETIDVLSEKSHLNIHSSSKYDIMKYGNINVTYDYYQEVSMMALFTNKASTERTIVGFNIYCDNITECLSPFLFADLRDVSNEQIDFELKNEGWGDTGELTITASGISYLDSKEANRADISLYKFANKTWHCPAIEKGGMQMISIPTSLIKIKWKDDTANYTYFSLDLHVKSDTDDFETSLILLLFANKNGLYLDHFGEGDSESVAIIVDTSVSSYEKSYKTYQPIPANGAVRLPILFFPTKSCTMSIRVSFELDDGEVVEANPITNAKIMVPYYEELYHYIQGDTFDWDKMSGDYKVYFPFNTF